MDRRRDPKKPANQETNKQLQPLDAKTRLSHRAVRLLARRDHTRQELVDKLKRSKNPVDISVINEVLDRLESKGYLKTPEVVASQLIPQYQRQRKGSRWIENKLRTKGIKLSPEQKKDMGLQNMEVELANAQELLQKKFKSLGPFKDHKEKARAMRALASRGFPMDVIMKAISGKSFDSNEEVME